MGVIVFLALVGVPLIEIAAFIEVGSAIGLWSTLAVIIVTAIVGTALLRHQGLSTLHSARCEVEAGRMPVREVFDGICILAAGAFLLTPGFVTDAVGLALMVPLVRTMLGHRLRQMATARGYTDFRAQPRNQPGTTSHVTTMEGEFHEIEDTPPDHGRHE